MINLIDMKKFFYLLILPAFLFSSCGAALRQPVNTTPAQYTLSLSLTQLPPSNIYINLDYGIRLNVLDKRASEMVLNRFDANATTLKPIVSTYPDVKSFVSEVIYLVWVG